MDIDNKNINSEEHKKLIITPVSNILLILELRFPKPMTYTRKNVRNAPANPANGSKKVPKESETPDTITKATPNEAPPEIPSVKGSTKGFL